MLEQLRNLQIDRMEMEELIALYDFSSRMIDRYNEFQATLPEWLQDNHRSLKNEIKARMADSVQKRLKEIDSRIASLATVEEKRTALREERERLSKLTQ